MNPEICSVATKKTMHHSGITDFSVFAGWQRPATSADSLSDSLLEVRVISYF